MKDENKTKEQLIDELVELRQPIAELEASEATRKLAEDALKKRREELQRLSAQLVSGQEAERKQDTVGVCIEDDGRGFDVEGVLGREAPEHRWAC